MKHQTQLTALNCIEIEALSQEIDQMLQKDASQHIGLRVIDVAIRKAEFPVDFPYSEPGRAAKKPEKGEFVRGEISILLQNPVRREKQFLFTLHLDQAELGFPYFEFQPVSHFASARGTTLTPLFLWLEKNLTQYFLTKIESIPGERFIIATFSPPAKAQEKVVLHLCFQLIPAKPRIFVIGDPFGENASVVASSHPDITPDLIPIAAPEWRKKYKLRAEFLLKTSDSEKDLLATWSAGLQQMRVQKQKEALSQNLSKKIESAYQAIQEKIKSLKTTLAQANAEPPWRDWGKLLTHSLYTKPQMDLATKSYRLPDPLDESEIVIPGDPQLTPTEQVAHFFHLQKRKDRRLLEANSRLEHLLKILEVAERYRNLNLENIEESQRVEILDWARPWQKGTKGLGNAFKEKGKHPSNKSTEKHSDKLGKAFLSSENLEIWVGRNKKENAFVTFKLAKGNDLWMHVKGRPSAHLVIRLPKGRTASLDSLLEAAQLLLHYSNGKKWGKVEVDYTFRKYVLHLPGKDPAQVRYSQNKSIVVQWDESCLAQILGRSLHD